MGPVTTTPGARGTGQTVRREVGCSTWIKLYELWNQVHPSKRTICADDVWSDVGCCGHAPLLQDFSTIMSKTLPTTTLNFYYFSATVLTSIFAALADVRTSTTKPRFTRHHIIPASGARLRFAVSHVFSTRHSSRQYNIALYRLLRTVPPS